MKEPDDELRAGPEERETPDFDALVSPEELVRGERTRDDFFDAVLGLDEPATVDEVAELAGHGRDAAREYLEWFRHIGIVERTTESPATYRRNREYLTWRRVQRLRDDYEPDELVAHLETETNRDREFEREFGVETPDEVRISEHAEDTGASVEDVWRRLSAWRTTRRRIALLERALTTVDGAGTDRQGRVV
jgi:hypothetical protein